MTKNSPLIEEIKRIAKLAHITLTVKETEEYAEEFATILNYISRINKLDLSMIEPTNMQTNQPTDMRIDTTKNSLPTKQLFFNSKKVSKEHFVVPPTKNKL